MLLGLRKPFLWNRKDSGTLRPDVLLGWKLLGFYLTQIVIMILFILEK